MQEEVENKSVMLIINSTKFTGRVLKSAISKYLAHRSEKRREKKMDRKNEKRAEQAKREAAKEAKRNVIPRGKQSVKDLIAQNRGVSRREKKEDGMPGCGIELTEKKIPVSPAVQAACIRNFALYSDDFMVARHTGDLYIKICK